MESTNLGRFCLAKLNEMIEIVAAMDDGSANTVPDLPGANSAYQLLEHCLGMVRFWTKEEILGEPTGRDRAAEFEASGEVAELVQRARRVRAELEADLARMDPAAEVSSERAGDRFWGTSVDGVLLHVFEELCQHLGHLEITRDLVSSHSHRARLDDRCGR